MRVGPYEIRGELGRGGMGVVYRALDPSLGREIALKVMLRASPSAKAAARFVREVQLAARASGHPGIVGIHQAGTLPDGRLYYTMDLVPGRSIEDLTRAGPLPPRDAARLVAQAAEAVGHAHAQGVVHRDIAPKNILVDAAGHARILDFGLARPLDEVNRLTATGAVLGTPLYMAPEQAQGAHGAGPPADIYALGATLYAALSGRAPFREGPIHEILRRILLEEPEPLPEGVPEPLRAIVGRAMAKDPRDRYASAEDLARDLRAFDRGERTPTPSSTRGSALLRRILPKRRPPALILLVALAAASGVVAVSVILGGTPPPEAARGAGAPETPPPGEGPAAGRPDGTVAGGPVAESTATLRDPGAAGRAVSLAFRALLPLAPDPQNPFILWEEAERARLEAASAGTQIRAPEPAVLEALRALGEAVALHPSAALPAWAAATAAIDRDAEALDALSRAAFPDAARVAARLRLVRGEPEEALVALDGDPTDDARLLRGLAHALLPDLGAARSDLDAIQDPALADEAAFLRVALAFILPPAAADQPFLEWAGLHVYGLGSGDSLAPPREVALDVARRAHGNPGRPPPADLAMAEVQLQMDHGRAVEAIQFLDDAVARDPENERLRDVRAGALEWAYTAGLPSSHRMPGFGRDGREGARAAVATLEITPASILAAAGPCASEGSLCPVGIRIRARFAPDLDAGERQRLLERARGLDALGPDFAGRLLDRALRVLVSRQRTDSFDTSVNDALRLARMASVLTRRPPVPLLIASLLGTLDGPARDRARPPGFGAYPLDEGYVAMFAELEAVRCGAEPAVLLVAAEICHERAVAGESGSAQDEVERALGFIQAALDAAGTNPAPETRLLQARCLRLRGESNLAGEIAHRALIDYARAPLLRGPTAPFLRAAADVLEGAGRVEEALEARRLADEIEGTPRSDLTAAYTQARSGEDPLALARAANRLLALDTFDPQGTDGRVLFAYCQCGRPWDGLLIAMRPLLVGDWSHFMDLPGYFAGDPIGMHATEIIGRGPGEGIDGALGLAATRVLCSTTSRDDVLRGVGGATSLLALGIAGGPLLSIRAYGRLRLGDARGALADAAAAVAATPPSGRPKPWFARTVEALAAARLGDRQRAERALQAIGDPDQRTAPFRSPAMLDPEILRWVALDPVLGPLMGEYMRRAVGQ